MLEPINDSQEEHYLRIRKKHLLIGVVLFFALISLVSLYLFSQGLYISFIPPVKEPEPLSPELILRFEELQIKANEAIEKFNELNELKNKLESPSSPKNKPTPNTPKELGKGGCYPSFSYLDFKAQNYDIESSFLSVESIFNNIDHNIPLFKSLFTLAIYKSTNLPRGVPLLGDYIFSSGFGIRPDPFTSKDEFHYGIDFAAQKGTPVVASEPGVVTKAVRNNDRSGLGNYIEISHPNNTTTTYGHLDTLLVNLQQKVKRGDVLGTVGSTGRSTGPHLHFEVNIAGTPVDPLSGKTAFTVKPSPLAMAAVNAEAKARCAELLLIVVDENATLMKECLQSGGKKAKDILISRFQEGRSRAIRDRNTLLNDCTYVDENQKLQSSNREGCHPDNNN
jgi:murein DD-endopeptidase MepM/ murein hydrolase activator NlpD